MAFFLLFILGIGCICSIVVRVIMANQVKLFDYLFLWAVIIYLLCPAYVLYTATGLSPLFQTYLIYQDQLLPICTVVLSLICLVAGYQYCNRSNWHFAVAISLKQQRNLSLVLISISLLSFFVFVFLYGGIAYVLENISAIRSGYDENKSYLGAFVRMFTYYLELGFYLFLSYFVLNKDNIKLKYVHKVLIFMLFLVIVFKLVVDGGRQGFIDFFICCFLLYIIFKGKINIVGLFVSGLLSLFIILFGKTYIFSLFTGYSVEIGSIYENESILEKLSLEFSHQYFSIVMFWAENFDNRNGVDFVAWLLKPFKLTGLEVPDSISYFITFLVSGIWESTVPPGLISLGLYNGGPILTVILFFILGYAVRWLENTFCVADRQPLTISLYVLFAVKLPYILSNGDPALILQYYFVYIILFALLMFKKGVEFRVVK